MLVSFFFFQGQQIIFIQVLQKNLFCLYIMKKENLIQIQNNFSYILHDTKKFSFFSPCPFFFFFCAFKNRIRQIFAFFLYHNYKI